MNRFNISLILLTLISVLHNTARTQSMQLSEVIIISASSFKKNMDSDALKTFFIKEVTPTWNSGAPGTNLYLLQADRGAENGEFLLACMANTQKDRQNALTSGSPFTDKTFSSVVSLSSQPSDFLSDPKKFTEYNLIGATELGPLPEIDILGIHYIQVRKDKSEAFEIFVKEQLHPQLSQLLPDMGLFYYKAVAGEYKGSYITIFAISSVKAREKYWPTGASETAAVKEAFRPLNELARELETYLVEGSYLLPESGGAAAYFESLKWTDFVSVK